MRRELVFTPAALADLEEIFWFIAADNPPRARSYIAEIEQACGNLCNMPHMGLKRPDLRPELYILSMSVPDRLAAQKQFEAIKQKHSREDTPGEVLPAPQAKSELICAALLGRKGG